MFTPPVCPVQARSCLPSPNKDLCLSELEGHDFPPYQFVVGHPAAKFGRQAPISDHVAGVKLQQGVLIRFIEVHGHVAGRDRLLDECYVRLCVQDFVDFRYRACPLDPLAYKLRLDEAVNLILLFLSLQVCCEIGRRLRDFVWRPGAEHAKGRGG